MGWGCLIDLIFGMVVVDAQIKLPRKFQVDPKTQTHFLSDLFFLIAIRPVVGFCTHNEFLDFSAYFPLFFMNFNIYAINTC